MERRGSGRRALGRAAGVVGFSCIVDANGTLATQGRVGDPVPFEDALRAVTGRGETLVAVMHSEIDDTGPGLECARRVCEAPLGAWPNCGTIEPPNWQFENVATPGRSRTSRRDGSRTA